jgi:cell shape-determining protein MreC|tara:strand:+ start:479 stop:742 length:264 start_codon:yes stop_codon:yes gene_type:complete
MLKEIKYFIFFLFIVLFIFFSIKYYISDENKKKTFRNLSLIDKSISVYDSKLPIMSNDTDNIVKYLNNDKNTNKKKYSFWDLLKNEN